MVGVNDFSKPTSVLNDADVGDTPNLMYSFGETDYILKSRQKPKVIMEIGFRMVLKRVKSHYCCGPFVSFGPVKNIL
jgi:hypothetical protein